MRRDIAKLLETGQEATARIRVNLICTKIIKSFHFFPFQNFEERP